MMKPEELPALSPYILRAVYEWCVDNDYTPLIIVDAKKNLDSLSVPMEYVSKGIIVFNIHPESCGSLRMENDSVSFDARFAGELKHIYIPFENIVSIASEETQFLVPMEAFPNNTRAKNSGEGKGDDPKDAAGARKRPVFTEA